MRLIRCFSFGKVSNSRAVLGMCLTCFTVLYFFYFSKAHEESRLLNIVNYVKVQCSVYTRYNHIFDSQIYQNTAESLILPGFFSGAFSFYYIVFFLNQIWMIDFYDFSRDCLLSFWISFIFLLVRNS